MLSYGGGLEVRPMRKLSFATAVVLLAAVVSAGWAEDTKQATNQVVTGAKKVGEGVEQTAKGIGKTVTEGAKEAGDRLKTAGEDAKPVGDRLHDSAKGFGEALLDGMKYVGRTIHDFFAGK